MTVLSLPVDQRVIDIDSRRFASIEKALVELITNVDDSYARLERQNATVGGNICVSYERHQNGAVLTVTDQAEGMVLERLRSILSYGGAHSSLSHGEAGGRGYFGRGLKQAVYGLGYGWIESVHDGRLARVDLFRDENGAYLYDDWDGDRLAEEKDFDRLSIPVGGNGTRVTIIVENLQTNIPYFRSLVTAITNNIYLRDIMNRRIVSLINVSSAKGGRTSVTLHYEEPEATVVIGPHSNGSFIFQEQEYSFQLTLKRAIDRELVLKGDERTNGLLVISGTAVLDCQFFRFENQLGTEYLFGTVSCPSLIDMLANGRPVISDEREGLNTKDPFVTAFADALSDTIAEPIKKERQRLSHIEHATTSKRTQFLLEQLLQRMNRIAVQDLGIVLPPGPGSGQYGPFDTGRPAVLRFSTPFYYRQVGRTFRVSMIVDKLQLIDQDVLSFVYDLPESMTATPRLKEMEVADLPTNGRFEWALMGTEIGVHGKISVTSGPYFASCEVVIAEQASGKGYYHPSGRPPVKWAWDNATDLFRGYELRNLDNDIERAVYSQEERLILINTEAPIVQLYVSGQGRFKDGARLLLAELFMDVITDELAKRYVDRTSQKGDHQAYQQVKQTLIRRYGVEIHRVLLGD